MGYRGLFMWAQGAFSTGKPSMVMSLLTKVRSIFQAVVDLERRAENQTRSTTTQKN